MISVEKKGETAWAAVVVFDLSIVAIKVQHLSDSHIVCAQPDNGRSMTYIISGYFQYSHPMRTYLDRISRIVRQLKGEKIIICLDANADSPMWRSGECSEEGEALEETIMELNLYVVNEANNPKTYSSPSGESNIDVTLVTEKAIRSIGE